MVLARRFHIEPKKLSPLDAAYIAGFVDGEGCISLHPRGPSANIKLFAHNCKRFVLDWIAEVTGVGAVSRHAMESTKRSESFYWQANSSRAIHVIRQIRPYLRIKAPQADAVMEAFRLAEAGELQRNKTQDPSRRVRRQAARAKPPRASRALDFFSLKDLHFLNPCPPA
jgi:hypothetical protein